MKRRFSPRFHKPGLLFSLWNRVEGDNRISLVKRKNLILGLMVEQNYITQEKADGAKAVDTLKKLMPKKSVKFAPHFVTYVRSELLEKYGQRQVEEGGLKVITTLDWDKQQIAEEEVRKGVEDHGEKYGFTNSALVAIDPKNGQVVSMVGSKDFFDQRARWSGKCHDSSAPTRILFRADRLHRRISQRIHSK